MYPQLKLHNLNSLKSNNSLLNKEFFLRNFIKTLLLNKKQSQSLDVDRQRNKKQQSNKRQILKGKTIDTSQNVDESIILSDLIRPRRRLLQDPLNESKYTKAKQDIASFYSTKWEVNPQLYKVFQRKLQDKLLRQAKNLHRLRKESKPLDALLSNYQNLLYAIHQKDNQRLIQTFGYIMEQCQEEQCTDTFIEMIILLGEYFIDLNDLNKAAFFLKQSLICGDMLRLYRKKIKTLLLLQNIASKLKAYQISILLLKKALEYCWLIEDQEIELEIYDQLGIRYYYLGVLDVAEFLHEKFMQGVVEPNDSAVRINSIKFIKHCEQEIEYEKVGLSRMVLNSLALPILNIFEQIQIKNNDGTISTCHPTCDQFKMMTYQNSKAKSILKFIVKSHEYVANQIEINNLKRPDDSHNNNRYKKFKLINNGLTDQLEQLKTSLQLKEKHKTLFIYHGKAPHTWIPQEILRIKLKHRKDRIEEQKAEIEKILKYDLQKQIQERDIPNLEKIERDLQNPEKRKKNLNFEKQDQIYISHLKHQDNQNLDENSYLEKYKNLINRIIENLVRV